MNGNYEGWLPDDNSDDEIQEDTFHNNKEAILFVIEATPSMLEPNLDLGPPSTQSVGYKGPPAKSKMEVALRSVYAMMKRKVISAPKDVMGVLIFGTEMDAVLADTSLKNSFLWQGLSQPTAQSILAFKDRLTDAEDNPEYLKELLPIAQTSHGLIVDALGSAFTLLRAQAPHQCTKRIFLITDEDDPIKGVEALEVPARSRRSDLADANCEIETFFIPKDSDSTFDLNKFYGPLISRAGIDGVEEVAWPSVADNLKDALDALLASLRSKEAMKRTAFTIPFMLSSEVVIGVNGYNLIGEEKKRLPVKVDLNTTAGEEVITKTEYTDSATGQPLDPKKDIKKYFQVGVPDPEKGVPGTKVFFDTLDVTKLRNLGLSPGLRLLGFKPRSEGLRFHESAKHPYFIYPNEELFSGSTRTFASLLKTMVEKDVVGFGFFIRASNARPVIVLLLAQEEYRNALHVQERPPGIHLIQLPFADDVRALGVDSTAQVIDPVDYSSPSSDLAREIIKKFTVRKGAYQPDQFANPALNHFYETLAAIALDEDELPEPSDQTIPQYAAIDSAIGDKIVELKAMIPEDEKDVSKVTVSKKRREDTVDPNAPPPDLSEFLISYKAKGEKLKNDELKAALKLMGESTTGTKAVLVGRINAYLEKNSISLDGVGGDTDEEMPAAKKSKRKVGGKKKKVADSDEDGDDADSEAGMD